MNRSELSPDTSVAPLEDFQEERAGFLSASSKLHDPHKLQNTSDDVQISSDHKLSNHKLMFKEPRIIIFLLNTLLWNSGGSIMAVLAYSYYLDMNLTEQNASTGMTCYGFGALTGSILLSIVSVKLHFNRLILHWVLNVMLAVLLVTFPLVQHNIAMAVILGLFGFSYGTLCANLGSLSEHITGSELLYLLYAYSMAAGGVGSFIGPIISANLQKNFIHASGFYFGGACCGAALIVMIAYTIYDRSYLTPHTQIITQDVKPAAEHVEIIAQSNLSLAAYL